jgi:hypothetical protein
MPPVTHVVGSSASRSRGYPRAQIGQSLTVMSHISRHHHPQSPKNEHRGAACEVLDQAIGARHQA